MGRPIKNLIGQRFGRLIVVEKTSKRIRGHVIWKCLCDCRKVTFVNSEHLRPDHTNSCGCLSIEHSIKMGKDCFRHGHALNYGKTKEYQTWIDMKTRCTNPKYKYYKDYGGRGIKVCDEWLYSFENFLAYLKDNNMYPKPAGLSIDRIDNDGNYEPGNIRWATMSEQNNNQRRSKKAA